jgi:hypothetical protein
MMCFGVDRLEPSVSEDIALARDYLSDSEETDHPLVLFGPLQQRKKTSTQRPDGSKIVGRRKSISGMSVRHKVSGTHRRRRA